jgi:hypothetical protein
MALKIMVHYKDVPVVYDVTRQKMIFTVCSFTGPKIIPETAMCRQK